MNRAELIKTLVIRILGVSCPHPVRVGIDGVDGVGKTTLADELANEIGVNGRPVIRASIDGFHNPRSLRYRMGKTSPEGYFKDSFNYPALTAVLLSPLGPGGTRRYRRAVFDYRTDSVVEMPLETAPENSILLFDGVFLLQPELLPFWDISIFLDAPFEVTVPRMAGRDGGPPEVDAPENRRYVEGQRLYLKACEPMEKANIVIDNTDLAWPGIGDGANGVTGGKRSPGE